MAANTALTVADLDFDRIKTSIKAYISSKSEFVDYDFEGSTISLLLDILAYNTYHNSWYLSMIGNEMFLDSAVLRDSVVSRAKSLGYTPRSARGASATLSVTITPDDDPDSVTIAKNTQWTTTIDGVNYTFVTPEAYTIEANTSGGFATDITITEGTPIIHRWTVDTSNPVKYILPNKNIDTTSISVQVQVSSSNTSVTTYTLADDIKALNGNSAVYFLQEVNDSEFEIYFGDGVLGKQPVNNNIALISYRVCNGADTNGASSFTNPATLGGYSTFTVAVSESASGGSSLESIDSIKFNAPKNYETQNRAVLAEDYKRIINREHGFIQSLRVWGGENNSPAVYGKVFISAKPTMGTKLSQAKKDQIKTTLKKYNVMSIDIEFVDPSYVYIIPYVTVKYDSSLTSLSAAEVRSKVASVIQTFETANMGTFDNTNFRASQFMTAIVNADTSIISCSISDYSKPLKIQKRFTPNFNASTKYTIAFNTPLEDITSGFVSTTVPTNHPGGGKSLESSSFTFGGRTCYLDDDGFGNVRIYYRGSSNQKIFLDRSQGTIKYGSGLIVLNSFAPTAASNDEIKITVTPNVIDVSASKYNLLLLSDVKIAMVDEYRGTTEAAVTVSTTGSVTQVNETAVGVIV